MYTVEQLQQFSRLGWKVDGSGLVHLSREQFKAYPYTCESIRRPGVKTLMICGCVLIFEGRHFCIE